MNQLSFLDGTDLTAPVVARARRADPETSHIAAEQIEANGTAQDHRNIIAAYLKQHPGQTNGEIAEGCGLDYSQVHKRMKGLEAMNLVIRGAKRYCTTKGRTGRMYTSWFPK